jgi:hypothetical protein
MEIPIPDEFSYLDLHQMQNFAAIVRHWRIHRLVTPGGCPGLLAKCKIDVSLLQRVNMAFFLVNTFV